VTIGALY